MRLTSGGIDYKQNCSHDSKHKNGGSQHRASWPALNEGCNDDCANTLCCLVNTRCSTDFQSHNVLEAAYMVRRVINLRFVKVFVELNRSVARVVIEPLKNSRPNLYIIMPTM